MNTELLQKRIRALAHELAYEEEANLFGSQWRGRKAEHAALLRKLYYKEKRT